jgi:hypothetical protein
VEINKLTASNHEAELFYQNNKKANNIYVQHRGAESLLAEHNPNFIDKMFDAELVKQGLIEK